MFRALHRLLQDPDFPIYYQLQARIFLFRHEEYGDAYEFLAGRKDHLSKAQVLLGECANIYVHPEDVKPLESIEETLRQEERDLISDEILLYEAD